MSVTTEGGWHLDLSFAECDALLAQPQRRATKDDYTAADFEACSGFLHQGSSSFYAASKLLPPDVRRGTVMLYSFCRLADDLVDELGDPERALTILHKRLDRVYDGVPCDHAVDRGLLCAAETWRIPKAVFVALLEGFQWDSEERHYETIDELIAYCVRVASTVGVMMTLVMGESTIPTLARACDLGVAFQLTNIARDVGEDARNGRCYLPEEWLRAEGLSSRDLIAKPELSEGLRKVVDRMLRVADQIYADAELGVRMLPYSCQPAVQAAHLIYRAIGSVLRDDLDLDSISSRARTSGRQKLRWAVLALLQTRVSWPLARRCFGDPAAKSAMESAEAFKEYSPLLSPFLPAKKAAVGGRRRSRSRSPSPSAARAAVTGWAVKTVRCDADGWPLLGDSSWRTRHLGAPRDQTPRVGKLRYLAEARAYGDVKGLSAATIIIVCWAMCLHRGLTMEIELPEPDGPALSAARCAAQLLAHVALMTFLYTGMFITAHDAMHGVVSPSYRRLNDAIGSLCVRCFALFDYDLLLRAHWAHHRHPATANDPDFDPHGEGRFWPWYVHFMFEYMSATQLASMGIAFNLLAFGLGMPLLNLALCWVAPALLSSLQLFYFGTYLPHRPPPDSDNPHRARSNGYPPWLSFLTCYHFGYHFEHHEYPYVPWWGLSSVRHREKLS